MATVSYCSGSEITCTSVADCSTGTAFSEWVESWAPGGKCIKYAEDKTYKGDAKTLLLLDAAGYATAQKMADDALAKYESVGFKITGPNDSNFSPLQNNFSRGCDTVPGLCENFLTKYCSGHSRAGIANDPQLLEWCGCYAPHFTSPGVSDVSTECDVLCGSIGTIKIPHKRPIITNGKKLNGLDFAKCEKTVCVISDVTIDAASSSITNVNFDQMCSNCDSKNSDKNSVCVCIIEGTDIEKTFSRLENPASFTQACGKDSICIREINGQRKIVPCSEQMKTNVVPVKDINTTIPKWFWWAFGIGFLAVLILILAFTFGKAKKKETVTVYNHST
jgi:hypothetical protein